MRLILALTHPGFLGVDGGAYLHGLNVLLGGDDFGAGFPRPPLAPGWLLVPFISLLGDDVGYKVWSVCASMLPVIPVYLFAKRINAKYAAPFAATFVLLDLLHAEMLVTGALPLIGFSLLGMVWWAMCSLSERSERWSWREVRIAFILAGCLSLIPYVNQTAAGLAVVTIPVLLVALLWYNRPSRLTMFSPTSAVAGSVTKQRRPSADRERGAVVRSPLFSMLAPLTIGGLIALGALPWYMDVLPGSGILNYPGPLIYLTHMYDSAWWQLLIAWPLGVYMIWRGEQPWLKSLGVLTILLGTLLVFLSTDETVINIFYRSRYLLAIPFYIGITWVIWERWLPRLPLALQKRSLWLSGAAAVLLVVGYVSQFNRQTGYSDMATPATVAALDFLASEHKSAAGTAITRANGIVNNSFTLALWISALNKVPSPHTWTWHPPSRFVESDKDVRCVLGWVGRCVNDRAEVFEAAERLGVGYVLIDTRFPAYNERAPGIYLAPENQWEVTAGMPWLTQVFEQGTTKVWRLN